VSRLSSIKVYIIIGVLTLVVLGTAFVLGLMSSNKMRDIISEQFNQQQLTIAKGVASDIEEKFALLQNELHTLNLSPAVQYLEVSWPNRMQITMKTVQAYGMMEIGLVDAEGKRIYRFDSQGQHQIVAGDFSGLDFFQWAQDPKNKDKFFLKRSSADLVSTSQRPYMLLAIPTYQVSVDESHPQASGNFAGCLFFLLDPAVLAHKYASDIRSGQTGYAWVIDRKGFFLYHPEKDFIGKDAFEAREQRSHNISFDEINKIQREKMLTGEEGFSWYWSGWHRGIHEKVKKFIAYAPINLAGDNDKMTWSIAVVAPQTEVEGAIHEVYIRQFLLQGIVILIILLGGGSAVYYEMRWSSSLEQEVERKTAALKKSNDELSVSEKKYKSLVESAEDSICTVDQHGEVLSINRYGAQLLGYTRHGIIGKTISAIFTGGPGGTILSQVEIVFRTKASLRTTHEVIIADKPYTLNFNLTPIRDEADRVQSVLIIAHDITTSRRMEEQLYHTEKLASLGQLAAGVAHEINNPMAIILGYTDMLLEKAAEGSKEYKILKTIERQGNNCKRIVENLMSFARMPEGVQYDTDVNRNIELVLEVVQNTLLTKKVTYRLSLDENLPRVRGDAGQLQQVFLNLITNAVKAMPQGGDLSITSQLTPKGDRVEILVADTGVGIAKEHLPRIFDPFFTTRKVGEGTGLGLSVSYGIINKFGGNILCASKTREEAGESESGTTFTIYLPISRTNQEEPLVPSDQSPVASEQ
jgi:PAS domain S-box-containing protein